MNGRTSIIGALALLFLAVAYAGSRSVQAAALTTVLFPIALAVAMAFVIVLTARAKRLHAMQNQVYTGTPTSRRQVVLPNVAQFNTPGQAILVGTLPAFTLDSYQANFGGCTVLFDGSFSTTIIGRSANSPLVTAAVNPGDPLYYSQGTFDATTNVTYGGVLDKNISGIRFGRYDISQTAIAAGITNAAGVVELT